MPKTKKTSSIHVPHEIIFKQGPPESYWGIVAIHDRFNVHSLDLLLETEVKENRNGSDGSMLRWWIGEVGLPGLEEKVKKVGLNIVNGKKWQIHQNDGFSIIGTYRDGYIDICAYRYNTSEIRYEIPCLILDSDDTTKWGGPIPPPEYAANVRIKKMGVGRVVDYFQKGNRYGVRIFLDQVPKDYPHTMPYYMAWGNEIKLI